MAVVTAWTETEIGTLFVLAGVVTLLVQAPPAFVRRPRCACLALVVTPELLGQLLWFFTKAGASCSAAASPSCRSCTAAWSDHP